MNLQENIQRIKEVMGLLTEETQEKEIVLIDGTSSAGKSKTAELFNAVPFFESTDPNQWVQIDSDFFKCDDEQCIENRIKYDHAGDGPNPQAGEEFHKEMSEKRKNNPYGSKRGETSVGFHLHPHNKDLIKGPDSSNWYMAQEVKYGGHNKIIIDDIDNGILQYLPNENIKNVLLHAPIYILLQNIKGRPLTQPRDPKEVLKQYLTKYMATNKKPDITEGDPTTELTKDGLIGLLKSNGLDEQFINYFLNELGVAGNGVYYIKVKDEYMTPTTKLINVDSERTIYLDKFKNIVK